MTYFLKQRFCIYSITLQSINFKCTKANGQEENLDWISLREQHRQTRLHQALTKLYLLCCLGCFHLHFITTRPLILLALHQKPLVSVSPSASLFPPPIVSFRSSIHPLWSLLSVLSLPFNILPTCQAFFSVCIDEFYRLRSVFG